MTCEPSDVALGDRYSHLLIGDDSPSQHDHVMNQMAEAVNTHAGALTQAIGEIKPTPYQLGHHLTSIFLPLHISW